MVTRKETHKMITIKKERSEEVKKFNCAGISRVTGMSHVTVFNVLRKGKSCSKRTAYVLTKAINENAEIDDYFDRS